MMLPIDAIKTGRRFRQDHGDIAELAQSIEATGLLHPVVVDQDGKLLAGARRLAAFRILKRKTIPVTIVQVPR
jgi:ParB-like chromosome segregation protein Spo0J